MVDPNTVTIIIGFLSLAWYIVILCNVIGINKSLKKLVELELTKK